MGEESKRSMSSFPCLRFCGSNPGENAMGKNLKTVDRTREDLTEKVGLDLGHVTSVGC